MAFITRATFKVDNKGTTVPAGAEVTAKSLKCNKADFDRYVALGLVHWVDEPPMPEPDDESSGEEQSGSGDNG